LHVLYIEALIEVGNIKQAQSQYKYVTSMLYNEMGVKPSTALRKLYRQIKCNDDKRLLDLDSIRKLMVNRHDSDGAFFCDPDVFSSVYKLECRRASRTGQVAFLGMLTISRAKHRSKNNKVLKKVMGLLLDVLIRSLRVGDVVSEWSETQVLVLLPGITFEQADMVLARILNKHEMACILNDISVEILLKPINSLD